MLKPQGYCGREALIGFLDRVLPKSACGTGRACLQAILVCTMVSRRHELKEISSGPMWIEGSLVPEEALDGPETSHLQHTSQGGFWLVTRVERSQAEVTEQVLDRAEKGALPHWTLGKVGGYNEDKVMTA